MLEQIGSGKGYVDMSTVDAFQDQRGISLIASLSPQLALLSARYIHFEDPSDLLIKENDIFMTLCIIATQN
jgi:hypothetical protein